MAGREAMSRSEAVNIRAPACNQAHILPVRAGSSRVSRCQIEGFPRVFWAMLGKKWMFRASANSTRAQVPIGRNAEAGNPVQSQTTPLATGTTTAQPLLNVKIAAEVGAAS